MHSILKGEESFEDNKDRDRNKSNLRATPPGLVWSDKKVGCHKKGPILGRGHHVVSLVPDPVVELRHLGADHGEVHPLAQGGLGVAFYLQGNGIKENLDIADSADLISGCEIQK